MMSKVDVNGPAQHPVFAWLKAHAPAAPGRAQGEDIDWNFNKVRSAPKPRQPPPASSCPLLGAGQPCAAAR